MGLLKGPVSQAKMMEYFGQGEFAKDKYEQSGKQIRPRKSDKSPQNDKRECCFRELIQARRWHAGANVKPPLDKAGPQIANHGGYAGMYSSFQRQGKQRRDKSAR